MDTATNNRRRGGSRSGRGGGRIQDDRRNTSGVGRHEGARGDNSSRGGGRGGRGQMNARTGPPPSPQHGRGNERGGAPRERSGDRGGRGRQSVEAPIALTEEFVMYVAAQLKALKEDPSIPQLTFPSTLDNSQRRYIHNMAAKHGFHSKSTGKDDARFIFVTRAKTTASMTEVSLRVPPTPLSVSPSTLQSMAAFLHAHPLGPSSDHGAARAPPAHRQDPNSSSFSKSMPRLPPMPHMYSSSQQALPVFGHRDELLALTRQHQVVVIAGDTGCGKSTQIPQFLVDDGATRVVVTQPRRISAITLAQRIADERQVELGTDVGYSIRLDAKYSAKHTRLLLCTTGILLKWLSADPTGQAFTHIVVDEVHERDKHTDFLLILLQLILPHRPNLRVILMSATIQVDKFAAYFDGCPIVQIQGRVYPVLPCFLDDVLVLTRDAASANLGSQVRAAAIEYDLICVMCNAKGFADEEDLGVHVATCSGTEWHTMSSAPSAAALSTTFDMDVDAMDGYAAMEGSVCDHVAQVLAARKQSLKRREMDIMVEQYQLTQDALDGGIDATLVVTLLQHLLTAQYGDGAVLVFVPGWEDIMAISDLMACDGTLMARITLTMLHSKLSPAEQRRAFSRPARGTRKVILATNIAETSVTIEDVVYVIDTGKSKQSSVVNGYTALHTEWISQANCAQRKGRAGRVAPGVCFHLMSKKRYDDLPPFMTPELVAISLEEIVLAIQLLQYQANHALGFDSIAMFLHMALDPPPLHAIESAIAALQLMGALDDDHELTFLGWKLAQLGVPPAIGKMVLLGHFCGVFEPLLFTCCALTFRDPFVADIGMTPAQREQRKQIKRALGHTTSSDHLVVHAALQGYILARQSHSRQSVHSYCQQHWLVHTALDHILGVVKQVGNEFAALGYDHPPAALSTPRQQPMAQAVLAAGLYPNLMYKSGSGANFTTKDKFKVKLSSSTVLMYPKESKPHDDNLVHWVCFHDMMQSERVRVAQVATKVSPFAMALLVGHDAVVDASPTDDNVHQVSSHASGTHRWLEPC
ncbi:hypothetical protein, variant [Aphanomyces invadans]|uniref:RNA helicase n=1 Tax=Aphanomyces invadans TaxID=157072 RepID=A0A024TUK6_9STRA|nr:hypothetical protein, variant [Aphanomyces invadans]ETV97669.1 hypothetical protein, variant [Aphanomyces invadans]|eukprot:XP_008873878.1 hypothetical protein, variant [Aphanomyces invadans]